MRALTMLVECVGLRSPAAQVNTGLVENVGIGNLWEIRILTVVQPDLMLFSPSGSWLESISQRMALCRMVLMPFALRVNTAAQVDITPISAGHCNRLPPSRTMWRCPRELARRRVTRSRCPRPGRTMCGRQLLQRGSLLRPRTGPWGGRRGSSRAGTRWLNLKRQAMRRRSLWPCGEALPPCRPRGWRLHLPMPHCARSWSRRTRHGIVAGKGLRRARPLCRRRLRLLCRAALARCSAFRASCPPASTTATPSESTTTSCGLVGHVAVSPWACGRSRVLTCHRQRLLRRPSHCASTWLRRATMAI